MSSEQQELIPVEVAYALPDRQEIISLSVERGCSALEAARRSHIADHFPGIDLDTAAMGIFSRALDGKLLPTPEAYELQPMDRVEIYRPLLIDPKQARQARAAKQKPDKKAGKATEEEPNTGQKGIGENDAGKRKA